MNTNKPIATKIEYPGKPLCSSVFIVSAGKSDERDNKAYWYPALHAPRPTCTNRHKTKSGLNSFLKMEGVWYAMMHNPVANETAMAISVGDI